MEDEFRVRCQECGLVFHTTDRRESDMSICKGCREYLGISPEKDFDEFEDAELSNEESKATSLCPKV